MKKLFLNLLAILIVSFDISADCVPSGALYSQEDSGSSCTSVWKREGRRVTFPDLYAENIIVTGSGVCTHTQDYCCAPYYYESKCWPLFFDPEIGNGFWQQDVYTGILAVTRSQCQNSACGELVEALGCLNAMDARPKDFEFLAEQLSIRAFFTPAAGALLLTLISALNLPVVVTMHIGASSVVNVFKIRALF